MSSLCVFKNVPTVNVTKYIYDGYESANTELNGNSFDQSTAWSSGPVGGVQPSLMMRLMMAPVALHIQSHQELNCINF